jgi:hypothetical protein
MFIFPNIFYSTERYSIPYHKADRSGYTSLVQPNELASQNTPLFLETSSFY